MRPTTHTDGSTTTPQTQRLMKYEDFSQYFVPEQSWDGYEKCATSLVFMDSKNNDYYILQGNIYKDSNLTYEVNSYIYKFNQTTLQLDLYQTLTGISGIIGSAFLTNIPNSNDTFLLLNSAQTDTGYATLAHIYLWNQPLI